MTNKEKKVMDYIFVKSKNKESVLISPDELRNIFMEKTEIENSDIDEMVSNLVLDHYITMILSDKKGKPIYCISLDKKGESWERDKENKKKETIKLVTRTVLLAILSFAVGLLLKAIFS